MTTLIDLITRIDEFERESVIFAKAPWNANTEARVLLLTTDHRLPPEAANLGLQYFLEVDVARQVLDEFRNAPEIPLDARVRRVIQYAENDV